MQTFLCNVCERPLNGAAYELSTISGNPVASEQGMIRITRRHSLRLLHLCDRCGSWLSLGIRTVGETLSAAAALRNDPRWFDPASLDPQPAESADQWGA